VSDPVRPDRLHGRLKVSLGLGIGTCFEVSPPQVVKEEPLPEGVNRDLGGSVVAAPCGSRGISRAVPPRFVPRSMSRRGGQTTGPGASSQNLLSTRGDLRGIEA